MLRGFAGARLTFYGCNQYRDIAQSLGFVQCPKGLGLGWYRDIPMWLATSRYHDVENKKVCYHALKKITRWSRLPTSDCRNWYRGRVSHVRIMEHYSKRHIIYILNTIWDGAAKIDIAISSWPLPRYRDHEHSPAISALLRFTIVILHNWFLYAGAR